MNLNDLVGKEVRALILGQYQESLTPELYFKGTLVGIDQSIYIIETEDDSGKKRNACIPIMQCVLSTV